MRLLRFDFDDVSLKSWLKWRSEGVLPFFDSVIPQGLELLGFHSAPWCAIFRGIVLSGCEPHMPGCLIGNNVDPTDDFAGPPGKWIYEGIDAYRVKLGKLHVFGMQQGWLLNLLRGFDEGRCLTHSQLDWLMTKDPSMGYYNWPRFDVSAAGQSGPAMQSQFAMDQLTDEVIACLEADVPIVDASFWSPHIPIDLPPPNDEPPGQTYTPTTDFEERMRQYMRHFDWCMSRILPFALSRGYLVLGAGDNGTAAQGKGTFKQTGLNTPAFAWGPGVRVGQSSQLISAADYWRTVRELFGADTSVGGEGSVSFASLLFPGSFSGFPRKYVRTDEFPLLGVPPQPNNWTRWVRNDRYTLLVERKPGGFVKETLNDLQVDPDQLVNLLLSPLSPGADAAYQRLKAQLP